MESGLSTLQKIMTLNIIQTGQPSIIAKHLGTVQDVIKGTISEQLMSKKIDANAFTYGFELATPGERFSFGESIIVNGQCYATSTDEKSPKYGQVIHGQKLTPGGVFIIPHGAQPTHKASLSQQTMSFEEFYLSIYQQVKKPYAFVGLFHFETFHGTAVSKSPIYKENIFSHRESYYTFPETQLENVFGFVMGVAAPKEDLEKTNLETVLYYNPFDKKSPLVFHSHTLLLNRHVQDIQDITPQYVDHCLHLFNEGTSIQMVKADIFTVETTREYS